MHITKQKINDLIESPENQDESNTLLLRDQVSRYPYCQSLRLALARHCKVFNLADADSQVSMAAIYAPDRVVLFNLMGIKGKYHVYASVVKEPVAAEPVFVPEPVVAAEPVSIPQPVVAAEPVSIPEPVVAEVAVPVSIPEPVVAEVAVPVSISEPVVAEVAVPVSISEPVVEEVAVPVSISEPLIHTEPVSETIPAAKPDEPQKAERKTFLYWLKKTQRGYFLNSTNSGTSISFEKGEEIKTVVEPDPLEKNYQQNIFHVAGGTGTTIEFDLNKKEDRLIDQYLREDPQHIRQNHKAEDENTVEKLVERASRDAGIVTETLAAIYYQQKQYDKALKAYDDLRLKFPNKSTYFADLHEKIRNEVAGNKI